MHPVIQAIHKALNHPPLRTYDAYYNSPNPRAWAVGNTGYCISQNNKSHALFINPAVPAHLAIHTWNNPNPNANSYKGWQELPLSDPELIPKIKIILTQ